jgi:hypothetical protein
MAEVAGEVKLIFTADATSWSQVLDNAQKQLNKLKGQAETTGKATRAEMNEARGSIMVLGEEIGIHLPRHVQKFVAGLPGVASAMSAAFNGVAVFAIGMAIFEAGKKVVEFVEKTRNAARENARAWGEVEAPLRRTNEEMQVANDKLEEAIATLERKPHNGIKLAIDEAILSADTLGEKLRADLEKIGAVLEKQEPGVMSRVFMGTAGTGDVTEHSKGLQDALDKADVNGRARLDAMRKSGATQETIDSARRELDATRKKSIDAELEWARGELATAQKLKAGARRASPAEWAQDSRIRDVTGYAASLGRMSDFTSVSDTHADLQGQLGGDEAKHKNEEEAKAASEKRMQAARETLEQLEAIHTLSFYDEAQYWRKLADTATKGSDFYRAASKAANTAAAAEQKQFEHSISEEMVRSNEADLASKAEGARITEEITRTFVEGERAASELTREQQRAARESFQNNAEEIEAAERMGEAAIRIEAARGRLSALAAAMGMSALHQLSAANWTAALGSAQNAGAGIGLAEIEKHSATVGERAQLDDAAVRSATALGALRDSASELVAKFTDMPAHIRETLDQATSSINGAILKTITEPHARGQWKEAGKSIFTGVAGSGLNMAEGSIAKAFGISGVGKLGTQANPMWVRMAAMNAAGSGVASLATSVAGGSMSSLAGSVWGKIVQAGLGALPFLASGGNLSTNMPAIVGERGPELFVPSGSGRIVPNDSLGGTQHTWNIDARGAADPAATRAAVQRGILEAAPRIAAGSIAAQKDMSARRPTMGR